MKSLAYSLARVQMAYWTVIVVGSFIYVCFVVGHGSLPVLDSHIITLMGISGATGLAASAVDVSKDREAEGAKAAFAGAAEAVQALDAQIVAALKAGAGSIVTAKLFADRAAQVADISTHKLVLARSKRDDKTEGFLKDILTDQNGNSLHRLQLIFFTLVIGVYFVWHVGHDQSAGALNNVLSDQALALMGVAGGVYAGYKLPDKAA